MQEVEGLDFDRGLAVTGNNIDLYLQTCRAFLDSEKNAVSNIRQLMLKNQTKKAEYLAQTLNAQAAYLGVTGLEQATKALEIVLSERQIAANAFTAVLDVVECQLNKAMESLEEAAGVGLQKPSSPSHEATLLPHQIVEILTTLLQLVRSYDPEALSVLRQSRFLLRKSQDSRFDSLENALEIFDFETAEKLLQDAIAARS